MFGVDVGFNNKSELRAQLYDNYPHFKDENVLVSHDLKGFAGKTVMKMGTVHTAISDMAAEYYMSNPITRSSDILGDVVANVEQVEGGKAHG